MVTASVPCPYGVLRHGSSHSKPVGQTSALTRAKKPAHLSATTWSGRWKNCCVRTTLEWQREVAVALLQFFVLLRKTITGDKTWLPLSDPPTKQEKMVRGFFLYVCVAFEVTCKTFRYRLVQEKEAIRQSALPQGDADSFLQTAGDFWGSFLSEGATINAEWYAERRPPEQAGTQVLQDNARPHPAVSHKTRAPKAPSTLTYCPIHHTLLT